MKSIGIVGMPYSGKSTLFQALTRSGSAGGQSNQAVVAVPDERLGVLSDLERSKKVVHSKVLFVDVPGGFTAKGIAEFRNMDALAIVIRAFGPDADPVAELASVHAELLIADLTNIESGVEKARKRAKQAKEAKTELEVLERAHALLDSEQPLRDGDFDDDDLKALKGFGSLTLKPFVVIANVEEGADPPAGLDDALGLSAGLEAEVAGLDEADAAEMLAEFGVKESGLSRIIAAGYRVLDLITFLTTGEDETRAWEVRRGAKAPEAAGTIHSDLERGFIRAEVVTYEDLVGAGSWDAAKAKGSLRVEGKDYMVQEGDILNIRFAV
jgi:GTP-binding protein YchF